MALSRTWYDTLVDDTGNNLTGSIWNKAAVDSLMDAVDAQLTAAGVGALATTGGTLTGDLLFTDALYDIGKSGATRPRDGFFSRNVTAGALVASTTGSGAGVLVGAAAGAWGARLSRSAGGPVLFGVPGSTSADHFTVVTSAASDLLDVNGVGNVSIGVYAARATNVGTRTIQIFDGTAPAGTLANGVSLYSAAGKLWAMDAAGAATKLTP